MADRYDEELFLGYIEGDLTPEQTREFEKQLVDDARLRNLVAQLVIDRHRLRNLPKEDAPPNLMDAVNQHLERTMIQFALRVCGGRLEDTARMLGLSRKGLYLKRLRYGLLPAEDTSSEVA